jgi:drug/metabolite transporter (DMT)-like permease
MSSDGSSAATSAPRGATHAALLVVQLGFASLPIAGKWAMGSLGVSPTALAMARITGGAVVFVLAHRTLGTPRVRSVRDGLTLAGLALLGIVLNQALFLAGLRETSPLSATLLLATIPIFAVTIGVMSRRDVVSARTTAGVLVAFLGVAVLTRFTIPRRGDLFVLLNALSYAAYLVFVKRSVERYGALTVIAWVFGIGALLFAPVGTSALFREAPGWSTQAWLVVGFIVLVPTLLTYGLNAWALGRAPSSLVAIYVYVQPLVVAILARIFFGSALDARTLVAGSLIFSGVGIVARRGRPSG